MYKDELLDSNTSKRTLFVLESEPHLYTVSSVDKIVAVIRVGYRLGFFRYQCQIDTFKKVPVPKRCLNRYL